MACVRVAAVAVAVVAVTVTEAGKIYFPTEDLSLEISIRQCLRDPTCQLPPHLRHRERCKVDAESGVVNEIMEETRMKAKEGGGGGGGGGVVGSCNKMTGEVIWPETGECVALLTQGPCSYGQWVKLEKITFKPMCEPQPCTVRGRGRQPLLGAGPGVMVDGKCYLPGDLPPTIRCPRNEKAVTNEHGEVECDCRPGYVYYGGDNTCYEPYTQGPCLPGYIIRVEDSDASGFARCFPNECQREGMVKMNSSCHAMTNTRSATPDSHDSACYTIGDEGPCDAGRIIVDPSLAMPICLTTHSIFSNAVVTCARGSRRDGSGRCRAVFNEFLTDGPRFSTRRPGGSSLCPPGYFFAAATCLKILG